MRTRLAIWWHHRVRRHVIGPTIHLAALPSPWEAEVIFGDIWATRCAEPDCYWTRIEYVSRDEDHDHDEEVPHDAA